MCVLSVVECERENDECYLMYVTVVTNTDSTGSIIPPEVTVMISELEDKSE